MSSAYRASLSRSARAHLGSVGLATVLAVLVGGAAYAVCGDGTVDLGEDCDDGNTLNGDCCSSVCAFEANGSPCTGATLCEQSGACDGSGTCDAVPRGGCRGSAKSKLLLIDNNGNDAHDKVRWAWGGGDATTFEEFGVPTGTTNYALCIFAAGDLLEEAAIPADPLLWEAVGTRGYKYKDSTASPDGIRKVRLAAGLQLKAKALVGGKGINLPDPALNLPLPVTVQLVNSAGLCLAATYNAPNVKYNNSARFQATTP